MKLAIKEKIKFLMFNLLAPGIGHCVLHKWVRGIVMLLLTVGSLIWLIVAFAQNIIGSYYSIMNDTPIKFNLFNLLAPIILFFIVQIYSLLDIIFFCKIPEKSDTEHSLFESKMSQEPQE